MVDGVAATTQYQQAVLGRPTVRYRHLRERSGARECAAPWPTAPWSPTDRQSESQRWVRTRGSSPLIRRIATKQIRDQCPATAVIILTMFDDDETVLAALQAGAIGYLLKGAEGTSVLTAIRSAAAGNSVLSPNLIGNLTEQITTKQRPAPVLFPELTPRETEILVLLARGLTNPQIGEQLHLSAKTVANNVSMILTKLHVTQRGQAIVLARDAGLVPDQNHHRTGR
ncbi:response regulator transcription factor [bacterium]|nr:response regulator transcription factor [bacterium]